MKKCNYMSISLLFNKLFYGEKWNIGFINQNFEELLKYQQLDVINWLDEDDSDYSADPFYIEHNKKEYVFYEYLNFFNSKGVMKFIELDAGFKQKKRINFSPNLGCHTSYPYIFKHKTNIYCIPETHQLNKVSLFMAEDFPDKWVKVMDILDDFNGVDSSVIYWKSKWWLFTSPEDRQEQLYLFSSDSLFGNWFAHQKNPVKISNRSSRSAGQIKIFNEDLYRPAQNCSQTYGGSIVMTKIEELSESSFRDRELFEIFPDKNNYPEGIHNISFGFNKIIVDGRRRRFSLLMPFKKMLIKIILKKNRTYATYALTK